MARAAIWLSVALSLSTLSGCGTVGNTLFVPPERGGMRVYGGVRNDLKMAQPDPMLYPFPYMRPPLAEQFCLGTICAVDLPLSAVADTLTLPLTLFATRKDVEAPVPPPVEDSLPINPVGKNLKFDTIHGTIE